MTDFKELLRYDKGISKYAAVKILFPEDSYTHRMKRLQRAARNKIWTTHFNLIKVCESYGDGVYFVDRLVPKCEFALPCRLLYHVDGELWTSSDHGYVHKSIIDCLYYELLFEHERHAIKKAQNKKPSSVVGRVWGFITDAMRAFWTLRDAN